MGDERPSMPLAPTLAALGAEPRRGLDRLHGAGFRAVQLSATQPGLRPRELDGSARRDLAATLRREELDLAGIDFWIPVEHYCDAAQVDRAVSGTLSAIELAAHLGRCPVCLTLPRADGDGAGIANGADLVEILETIAGGAARLGVTLADHAHPPVKHLGIGVGLDPAAVIARGESPAGVAASLGDRLVSARLCDLLHSGMRGPIGDHAEGQLDVMSYRAALGVVRYRRPLVVDMRQWTDPWAGLEQTRECWDSCLPI